MNDQVRLSPREHALRVAVLDAVLEEVKKQYALAREEAEAAFAVMYSDGNPQQHVLLPGGEKIGQLTVTAAPPVVSMLNGGIRDWAEEHIGDEAFEEFIPDSVLASREVLAIVKAARPALVGRRLRSRTAQKLAADLIRSGGWLEDEATGKREKVADVTPGTVTGAFSFTDQKAAHRRERIRAEWGTSAELRELAGFAPVTPALQGPARGDSAVAGGESDAG